MSTPSASPGDGCSDVANGVRGHIADLNECGSPRSPESANSCVILSSSRNAASFSLLRTTKRLASSRCASAIQIVRPLESIAERHPKSNRPYSACQQSFPSGAFRFGFCRFCTPHGNDNLDETGTNEACDNVHRPSGIILKFNRLRSNRRKGPRTPLLSL